jgi:hypothetical protein
MSNTWLPAVGRADAARLARALSERRKDGAEINPLAGFLSEPTPKATAAEVVADFERPASSPVKAVEETPELREARASGQLHRVLGVMREQAAQKAEKPQSAEPARSRGTINILDFSDLEDDELMAVDTSQLTGLSATAFAIEVDSRLESSAGYEYEEEEPQAFAFPPAADYEGDEQW